VFWVISVYFNIRNTLPKYCTFLLGHPVYRVQGEDNIKRDVWNGGRARNIESKNRPGNEGAVKI
jgi:hypothetical protein